MDLLVIREVKDLLGIREVNGLPESIISAFFKIFMTS